MLTADQMAKNYQDGMSAPNTATKYKQGVQAYTGNPMERAASDDAERLYIQRVTESVTSGRRRAKLMAVPRETWANNAMNFGAVALATGARKADGKVKAHFQKWQPIYAQASAAAKSLPKGGRSNALNRVAAAMDVMMAAAGRTG